MNAHVSKWYEFINREYYKYYFAVRHAGFDVNEATTLTKYYRDQLIGTR